MKVQVQDIPQEGLDIDVVESFDIGGLRHRARALLHVHKAAGEVFVKGRADTVFELECSRCLRKFQKEVAAELDTVYLPADSAREGESHELHKTELETGYYEEGLLDIGELIQEQMVLLAPMKPLCAENCGGICPRCGKDLSGTSCGCSEKKVDPRLQVLKKLIKD